MSRREYPWYIVASIERPYTFDWWIGLSARAFYRWSHGDLSTARWQRLDRYLNARAYAALHAETGQPCARCGVPHTVTRMVRWQGHLYCTPCLIAVYPFKHGKKVCV